MSQLATDNSIKVNFNRLSELFAREHDLNETLQWMTTKKTSVNKASFIDLLTQSSVADSSICLIDHDR